MSEQIGKHKGAVETLLHEKKELSRILQIVNSQLQRHLSALEEAGIDTDEFIEEIQQGNQQQKQQTQRQEKKEKQRDSRENKGKQSRDRNRTRNQTSEEDEADPNELLEDGGEDDFGDRDFNPNR